jgi:hypothetical protein
MTNEIKFYMFGIAFAKRVPVAVLFFGWGIEAVTEVMWGLASGLQS